MIRNDFSGSKHGNTIGAAIAGTAFSRRHESASAVGMAYGIDKLYDNYQATNPYLWDLGINVGRRHRARRVTPTCRKSINYSASDLPEHGRP